MVTWTLRGRTATLGRGDIVRDWSATLVERWNLPDTLQVTGRTDNLRSLFALDGGVTLADESGVRFSGQLSSLQRKGDRTCTLTFESDLIRLWERIVYPTPTNAITAQTVDVGDVQTGAAETVLLHYISANAGPSALTARKVTGLTVPASSARGGTVTVTARFDNLGRLVADIGAAAGLDVEVVQSGTTLATTVTAAPDLSATARYGVPGFGGPGLLGEDWSYTLTKPDVTRAEVGGGGEGTARVFRERPDTTAETTWGRRVEAFIDQRQTTDTAELDKAGDDALAEGSQPVSISAPILDSPGLRLGVDVPLGALVTLDLDDERVVDRLRQLTTRIAVDSGSPTVSVEGVVGTADAGLTRSQKEFLAMRKTLRKVVTR
ncbi:MAG: Gp37-like protein [Motilibacteraceae bacterium]